MLVWVTFALDVAPQGNKVCCEMHISYNALKSSQTCIVLTRFYATLNNILTANDKSNGNLFMRVHTWGEAFTKSAHTIYHPFDRIRSVLHTWTSQLIIYQLSNRFYRKDQGVKSLPSIFYSICWYVILTVLYAV